MFRNVMMVVTGMIFIVSGCGDVTIVDSLRVTPYGGGYPYWASYNFNYDAMMGIAVAWNVSLVMPDDGTPVRNTRITYTVEDHWVGYCPEIGPWCVGLGYMCEDVWDKYGKLIGANQGRTDRYGNALIYSVFGNRLCLQPQWNTMAGGIPCGPGDGVDDWWGIRGIQCYANGNVSRLSTQALVRFAVNSRPGKAVAYCMYYYQQFGSGTYAAALAGPVLPNPPPEAGVAGQLISPSQFKIKVKPVELYQYQYQPPDPKRQPWQYTYNFSGWGQYNGTDFEPVQTLAPMVSDCRDGNEPDETLLQSYPYVYVYEHTTPVSESIQVQPVYLVARDANGSVTDCVVVPFYRLSGRKFVSGYILPTNYHRWKGVRTTTDGITHYLPYCPSSGRIEFSRDIHYGDFNLDYRVDGLDFAVLGDLWLTRVDNGNYNAIADFDLDGVVDINDLTEFCNTYLQPRPRKVVNLTDFARFCNAYQAGEMEVADYLPDGVLTTEDLWEFLTTYLTESVNYGF